MIDDIADTPMAMLPEAVRQALRAWLTSRQRIGHTNAVRDDYEAARLANLALVAALARHPEVLAP